MTLTPTSSNSQHQSPSIVPEVSGEDPESFLYLFYIFIPARKRKRLFQYLGGFSLQSYFCHHREVNIQIKYVYLLIVLIGRHSSDDGSRLHYFAQLALLLKRKHTSLSNTMWFVVTLNRNIWDSRNLHAQWKLPIWISEKSKIMWCENLGIVV